MSRDPSRKFFNRNYHGQRFDRERDRRELGDRDRMPEREFRMYDKNRNRSPNRRDGDKRSRSPRKSDKDGIDDNMLNELSKLPEPSELWESNHFSDNFPPPNPPPPSFDRQEPNFSSNYQQSYSGIYDEFPPIAASATAHLPPEWNQMSLPPPPTPVSFIPTMEEQMKKEAAIESEMRQQKAALSKQREDYIKKTIILKKELDTLKDQRNELRGDSKRSPSPDTKRFMKENTKLQLEIQNKLKTINNVVDMLNGIIGEQAQEIPDGVDTSERPSKRKSRSPSKGSQFNYVYYDPEMHWCRVCNEFPPTAKDYLNHLHSPQHHKMAAAHLEAPWHSITGMNEGFPNFPNAPSKRTPIKGLQFFVPSTAWYCKLCDQFIGDLHCASAHLKSVGHSKNYSNFVEQNPHWETDWISDRQRAVEKSRVAKTKPIDDKQAYAPHTITFHKDGFHTKNRKSPSPPTPEERKKRKEKKRKLKKKKGSSSSSSDSSASDGETKIKKKKKEKKSESDEKILTEWMSTIQMEKLSEHDRKLLDSLKNRIKSTEAERNRSAERSVREREREREKALAEAQRRVQRDTDRHDLNKRREDDWRRDSERRRSEERRRRSRDTDHSRQTKQSEADSSNDVTKKPEPKKMPFIGKMPVYKSLNKNKVEDPKKEEPKKKVEEDEVLKKKREAMDIEIQKKVAEFKERLAREKVEKANTILPPELAVFYPAAPPQPPQPPPPPQLVTPTQIHVPTPPAPPMPNLPKDFQEALDIIFPSDGNKPGEMKQESILGMPPGLPPGMPGFPVGPMGGQMLNPFSHLGLVQQPMMMGFDLNRPLFPRPQLYDQPLQQNQTRNQNQQKNKPNNKNNKNNQQQNQQKKAQKQQQPNPNTSDQSEVNGAMQKKQEQMDDLAMLGIDASDVGAGM